MNICAVFRLQLREASDCRRRRNVNLVHMIGSVGTAHANLPITHQIKYQETHNI